MANGDGVNGGTDPGEVRRALRWYRWCMAILNDPKTVLGAVVFVAAFLVRLNTRVAVLEQWKADVQTPGKIASGRRPDEGRRGWAWSRTNPGSVASAPGPVVP